MDGEERGFVTHGQGLWQCGIQQVDVSILSIPLIAWNVEAGEEKLPVT